MLCTLPICWHGNVHAALQPVHEYLQTTSTCPHLQGCAALWAWLHMHRVITVRTLGPKRLTPGRTQKAGGEQNCVSFCKVPRLPSTHQTPPLRSRVSAGAGPSIPKEHGTGPLPAWLGYPRAVAAAKLFKAVTLLFPLEFNKSFTPP